MTRPFQLGSGGEAQRAFPISDRAETRLEVRIEWFDGDPHVIDSHRFAALPVAVEIDAHRLPELEEAREAGHAVVGWSHFGHDTADADLRQIDRRLRDRLLEARERIHVMHVQCDVPARECGRPFGEENVGSSSRAGPRAALGRSGSSGPAFPQDEPPSVLIASFNEDSELLTPAAT